MTEPKTLKKTSSKLWKCLLLLTIFFPILISTIIIYSSPKDFNPIQIPTYSFAESINVPHKNGQMINISEKIGDGLLPGPEDLAYDCKGGFIYTGCEDGWIRRVKIGDGEAEVVEDWVQVGGRPLGVALGSEQGSLVVAEAHQGLLLVTANKEVQLLTNEVEGLEFKLTDGVDVDSNGIIYFTDASYKYNLHANMLDILEGRPRGRVMSFDPTTNETVVLVRDLYFANGLTLSPDQQSLIFCETVLRRCSRYHIHGKKKGEVEIFVNDLPGFPDNIRYDGEGHYWIALAAGRTYSWDMVMKYPILRKMLPILGKFVSYQELEKDSGVISVDLEGKPSALYTDPGLHLVTVGLKIGKYLYYGFLHKPYMSRVDLTLQSDQ